MLGFHHGQGFAQTHPTHRPEIRLPSTILSTPHKIHSALNDPPVESVQIASRFTPIPQSCYCATRMFTPEKEAPDTPSRLTGGVQIRLLGGAGSHTECNTPPRGRSESLQLAFCGTPCTALTTRTVSTPLLLPRTFN